MPRVKKLPDPRTSDEAEMVLANLVNHYDERQTCLDVAQALAPSQLRKCHRTELLGTTQRPNASDAREACPRHEVHDLGEQRLANIHASSSGMSNPRNYANYGCRKSNRYQTKSACTPQYLVSGSAQLP